MADPCYGHHHLTESQKRRSSKDRRLLPLNEEHYHLTKLSFSEFTNELDLIWAELQDPESNLSKKARKEGIDLSSLRGLQLEQAIRVERRESGFDVTAVVMAFVAHGVVEAVKAAWTHLIVPRIRRDLGDDAIKHVEENE